MVGKMEKHGILLERIPKVSDLQSAWFSFLFCANIVSSSPSATM